MKTPISIPTTILLCLIIAHTCNGDLVITVSETGGNVEFNATGSLNLTDLSLVGGGTILRPFVEPIKGEFTLDTAGADSNDTYNGVFSTPGAFGTGGLSLGTSGTGGPLGFVSGRLFVPDGFTGGSISATSIFSGQSFSTLGISPGTYTWSWGSGMNADSMMMNVVPEPSAFLFLAVVGLLYCSFFSYRLRKGRTELRLRYRPRTMA